MEFFWAADKPLAQHIMAITEIELLHRKDSETQDSPTLPVGSSDWASTAMLDEPGYAPLSRPEEESLSLSQLDPIDRKNFFILVFLYLLQGIPVGLAFGSIPFLLKSKLSYGQVGVFSLASYPYSLKLLWSPIVDAVFWKSFGRRKSWIVPIQMTSAFFLIYLGKSMEALLENAENNLWVITTLFFILVFLCATQDIAVDGWALTLLSPKALSYASTAQTVGLNTGYFTSFTVFLAFNSPDFANKYFRSAPLDVGLISLNGYLALWGWIYLFMTILVGVFKHEDTHRTEENGIISVYKSMFRVLRLRNIQILIAVHLVAKIGFQANEAVTNLKLLEKGFSKEDLALTVLIDFPFEIVFGYYAAKWSTGKHPLQPWLYAFLGRLVAAVFSMLSVAAFPKSGKVNFGYLLVIILTHVFGSFMSTIQFVCINAFHTQIADPVIGGTYMTTLNTISNLGGQWPRIIVLYAVDWFTSATCVLPVDTPSDFTPFTPFACATEADKGRCKTAQGVCNVAMDGYYVCNILCIAVGLVLFYGFIQRRVMQLQSLPTIAWRAAD